MVFDNQEYKQQVMELAQSIIHTRLEKAGKPVPDGKPPVYVIYARKSTKGKKKDAHGREVERQERSIPDQIKDCQKLAKDLGIKPAYIFKEEKSARKSANREVFEEMMDAIRAKKYTGIICWHPDRLGRNMKDAGEIIDLIDKGVIKDLKFPQFTFQNDPNGLMTLGLQFLLAKAYSDNLSANVSRGNRNIIQEGKAIGNKALRGYKVINKHQRPDGRNFELIKQAFELGLEGKGQVYVSDFLNQEGLTQNSQPVKMTKQKVSEMFADPSYTGFYLYGKTMVDLTESDPQFQPVISYFDFLRLRNVTDKSRGFKRREAKATPLLDKMVFCGHCGNLMTTYLNKNKKDSLITYLRVKCANPSCETQQVRGLREIRGKVVFDYIYQILSCGIGIDEKGYNKYVFQARQSLIENSKQLETQQRSLSRQTTELEAQMEEQKRILAKATGKTIDETNTKITELRTELESLKDTLAEIKSKRVDVESLLKAKVMTYADFLNFFENLVTTIKTSDNQLAVDNIIRMVFLNFVYKDKNILAHQWNPDFETIAKLPSVLSSRGDWTRTSDLVVPNDAL